MELLRVKLREEVEGPYKEVNLYNVQSWHTNFVNPLKITLYDVAGATELIVNIWKDCVQ